MTIKKPNKNCPSIEVLQGYQCELARSLTRSEITFQTRLKAARVNFEIQALIPPYIADFVIQKRMLIIELDGAHHYTPEKEAYDERRTIYLRRLGFALVRIPNAEAATWPLKKIRRYPKCDGAFRRAIDRILTEYRELGMQPPPPTTLKGQPVQGAPF